MNALARQLVENVVPDPAQAIDRAAVDRAREILIERNDTHLDSLAERLREDRVRRIVEPSPAIRSATSPTTMSASSRTSVSCE